MAPKHSQASVFCFDLINMHWWAQVGARPAWLKWFLFLYIIANCCTSLCLAADFRDAEWGMSSEQVQSLEKTEPVYPKKDTLTFRGKVAGKRVDIIYEFKNDKLRAGVYLFNEKNSNNNVYLQDYEKINEFLSLRYGNPESRKVSWSNELYKEKKGYHGLAVSLGHLVLESTWNKEKNMIVHKLSESNRTIEHSISYFDKSSLDIQTEKFENEEMKGL